jgi:hypothetical protein
MTVDPTPGNAGEVHGLGFSNGNGPHAPGGHRATTSPGAGARCGADRQCPPPSLDGAAGLLRCHRVESEVVSTKPEERTNSSGDPTKPAGCKRPYRTGGGWRRCGRPKCCRGCRDLWGWKQASCLSRSFTTLPPTHFATLRPRPGATNPAFGEASAKFLRALSRRSPGLEYLKVNEWRNGVQHAHALLRAQEVSRRAVHESRRVAGLRCAVKRVRNPTGAARYVFKHTRRPDRKAELPPAGFRGRLVMASRGFLTKPFHELWSGIRAGRAEVAP